MKNMIPYIASNDEIVLYKCIYNQGKTKHVCAIDLDLIKCFTDVGSVFLSQGVPYQMGLIKHCVLRKEKLLTEVLICSWLFVLQLLIYNTLHLCTVWEQNLLSFIFMFGKGPMNCHHLLSNLS